MFDLSKLDEIYFEGYNCAKGLSNEIIQICL
jgi:hypothetical protein